MTEKLSRESVDLIRYRLNKSRAMLTDAKEYAHSVSLESTVNRIYYAMFYAVSALLLTKKLYSSKHSGALALFNKEFVKTGIIEGKLGKFYADMFDRRQEGDYRDFVKFKKQDVEQWLIESEVFVKAIEKITFNMIGQK
jgi:hypothetical protein